MRRFVAVLLSALALPGAADAARFAVGVTPGADRARLTAALESRTGGHRRAAGAVRRRARGAKRRPRRRDSRRRLRGAPRRPRASDGIRSQRSPVRAAVVRQRREGIRRLGAASDAAGDARCRHRLRHRRRASGIRREDREQEELRRRFGASGPPRPRHVRRGPHCRIARKRGGNRRDGVPGAAARREGRSRRRRRPVGRGGARHPLGRRPARKRDQPQPRRSPRPARPDPRRVLATRGGRRCVCDPPRSHRRGSRWQRRPRPGGAVALRELPGCASARARSQRRRSRRQRAHVLEPRSVSTTTSPRPATSSSRRFHAL